MPLISLVICPKFEELSATLRPVSARLTNYWLCFDPKR